MSVAPRVSGARVVAGAWQAILDGAGDTPPAVEAVHDGVPVPGVTVVPVPAEAGRFALRVPIPSEAIVDGLSTVVIRLAGTGEVLGQVAVITGAVAEGDLRAEVDLLRAELDMLKRAFRRHCLETAGG